MEPSKGQTPYGSFARLTFNSESHEQVKPIQKESELNAKVSAQATYQLPTTHEEKLAATPAENKLNSLETNTKDFWGLRKLFSENSENKEDMLPAGITGKLGRNPLSPPSHSSVSLAMLTSDGSHTVSEDLLRGDCFKSQSPLNNVFSLSSFIASDDAQDPITISQKLITEINNLTPGMSLDSILNDLKTLLNLISSISDSTTLANLETNIQAFDAIRAQKTQVDDSDWGKVDNLVIEIKMGICTQQMGLPNADKEAILKKIKTLLDALLNKVDQFSPEQITDTIDRVATLQKEIDGLDAELQQSIDEQIAQINSRIDARIDQEIQKLTQKNLVKDFKADLMDYLEKEDNINALVAKEDEIDWDTSTEKVILLVISQLFSTPDLLKWMAFIDAVEEGIPNLTGPNPDRASKIRNLICTIYKNQDLVSVVKVFEDRPNTDAQPQLSYLVTHFHIAIKQCTSIEETKNYLNNDKELLKDLSTQSKMILHLKQIQDLMGNYFFSFEQINKAFKEESVIPSLPASLTLELLSARCPFESEKKVYETHFLFSIPSYMGEHPCNPVKFLDSFNKYSQGNIAFKVEDTNYTFYPNIMSTGNFPTIQNCWVLIYIPSTSLPFSSDYRLAKFDEMVSRVSFWGALGIDEPISSARIQEGILHNNNSQYPDTLPLILVRNLYPSEG